MAQINLTGNVLASAVGGILKGEHYRGWDHWLDVTKPVKVDGLGTVTVLLVEDEYTYERSATPNQLVFKVEFDGGDEAFFRIDGEADSYGYREWESLFQVSPQPKTVTVYERI